MRAFDFYAAKDSSEAVALLAQHGPAVKVLAGGTDLLADLKFASASHAPKVVVDISRADDLRAKLLGLLVAPATKIAQLANAPAAKVARVIQAYASKGEAA